MQPGWQSVGSLGSGGRPVNLNAAGLAARLGRVLLPPSCLVCGAPGAGTRDLCRACTDELPWLEAACARCALPLPVAAAACGECLRTPPPFAGARAALRYAAPVDRLLPHLKFHAGLAQGRLLAQLLLQAWPQWPDPVDLLLPLPLHRSRLGQRGYNQALELARPLARAWQRPLAPDALRRVRATAAQSELDAAQRRRNVRGAFAADAALVAGRRVLLIDDVITTGATLREAAATLLAAGAAEVRVLAAARAAAPGRG
jgi:ComF family protein